LGDDLDNADLILLQPVAGVLFVAEFGILLQVEEHLNDLSPDQSFRVLQHFGRMLLYDLLHPSEDAVELLEERCLFFKNLFCEFFGDQFLEARLQLVADHPICHELFDVVFLFLRPRFDRLFAV